MKCIFILKMYQNYSTFGSMLICYIMPFVDEHLSTFLIFEEGYMFIKIKYKMFVHMYTNY